MGDDGRIASNAWAGDGDYDGEKDTIFRRNADGSTEIDRYFNGMWHTYHSDSPFADDEDARGSDLTA
jgi:hypothetical protein